MRQTPRGRSDFDSPWKEALEHFLPAFLLFFFPQVHGGIDWSKPYEALDKELHRLARGGRGRKSLADKLFKVWRINGEEAWLLIHIEVQGEPEDDFPLRMFRYNIRAFDRYNRTVISLAVLTDERLDWRPDHFTYGEWGASTNIQFLATKLLDWRGREAELETSTNPFGRVVVAHLRALQTRQDPQGRSRYKLALVKGLYEQGWTADDVRQLFRVIDWLMDLPAELQDGFEDDVEAWEEEKNMGMPYVSVFERRALEKGLTQGLKQGLQEGLHEGFKAAIASALKGRFGKVDRRLMAKVDAISDLDTLRAVMEAISGQESLKQIRERLQST